MENHVAVKEKKGLFIGICLVFSVFFLGTLILCLALGRDSNAGIIWGIFLPPTILFGALGGCSNLLFAHVDIYTSEKMVRLKRGRVVFEIFWTNVEYITYTKPSILGWLSFGGNYAFFIKCKEGYTEKGFNAGATMFNAHYKVEDVFKIQKIIPIHINM